MEYIKLNELCDINIGKTPSRANSEYWGQGSKWISIGDMKETYISNTKEQITSIGIKESNIRIVPKETVIMSFKLTIGKVGITAEDMFTNEAIASFPIKDNSKLDKKYLFYALQTLNLLSSTDRAVMGATLNKAKLNQIKIPYTNIDKQKEVAKLLDKSQSIINKRKRQIKYLDKLIQSVFYDMFGDPVINSKEWDVKKLAELGELKRGKSKHRPRNAPELLNGPYPLVQTGDIANAGLFLKKYNSTYSELGLNQSKMWPKGTLCITIAANIAKTSILTFDACFPDSVVAFIEKSNVNKMYIQIWMTFLQKVIEESAPESAQKNINLKILSELDVIVPPIELQNSFAEKVIKIENQKILLEESLTELENNFNSIMQQVFKGELFQ